MPRKIPKLCKEEECAKLSQGVTDFCIKHGGGTRCSESGCTKSALKKTNKCFNHGGGEICIISGCKKGARHMSSTCIEHGGGRRCDESGCMLAAIWKTNKCSGHGGGRLCIKVGCTKQVAGKTDSCIAHGGGIRCYEHGCTKSAQGKTGKCISHGGGKRCNEPECNAHVSDCTDKCLTHGGGKRCNESGCLNRGRGKLKKCISHGGGDRCSTNGCVSLAREKNGFCKLHGGGRRCPNCITWPDSRSGSSKYDGYCVTCFKRLFPSDPRSIIIHEHTKEIRVRNAINVVFEGFVHNTPLYTGNCECIHRRRIDHRKLINGTLLCIETDEFGHRGYDQKDEDIRYDDLFMIHSGKWIFIRFNPDGKSIDMEDKLESLIDMIKLQIDRIEHDENSELVEIIKMFY